MDRWVNMTEQVQKRRLDMVGSFYVTYYTELLGQILENDCDVEFGVHVSEDDAQKEGVRSFGGFTAAVLNYTGDYSSIYMAYIELNRWIKKNDLYITGPSTERFVISPIDLTNKEDQVTQIIIPVSDVKPQ